MELDEQTIYLRIYLLLLEFTPIPSMMTIPDEIPGYCHEFSGKSHPFPFVGVPFLVLAKRCKRKQKIKQEFCILNKLLQEKNLERVYIFPKMTIKTIFMQ